ncbi:MAG: type II toxin-antitoxin system RelE/ParE family toxin [Balneolaceae bacterium]
MQTFCAKILQKPSFSFSVIPFLCSSVRGDDIATAEKWALKLIEKTDQLIEQPGTGRIVPEYNEPNLRELIFGNYRVIYRIRKEENTIYIQTV